MHLFRSRKYFPTEQLGTHQKLRLYRKWNNFQISGVYLLLFISIHNVKLINNVNNVTVTDDLELHEHRGTVWDLGKLPIDTSKTNAPQKLLR